MHERFAAGRRPGIGGRLFLAFVVIMGLSLVSGLIGWRELRQVAVTQQAIVEQAMPSAIEAREISEVTARLVAASPLLTGASSEARRVAAAQALFTQAGHLRELISGLDRGSVSPGSRDTLAGSAERLLQNLTRQNELVRARLALEARSRRLAAEAAQATIGLSDLTETLVSNAAAGSSAVIANLYDLVEDEVDIEPALQALDRLVEVDLYMMERMFELRLRSSQVGLLLNQLGAAAGRAEIDDVEAVIGRNLEIIGRRVASIRDPVRRLQAEELFSRLIASTIETGAGTLFDLRREALTAAAEIDLLADENRGLSEQLRQQVVLLVEESRGFTEAAAGDARAAVALGITTIALASLFALLIAAGIVGFYVRGNIVRRLNHLARAMTDLARGNLDVQVDTRGRDELSDMARSVQFFKEEAVRKRELEVERERTAEELRRHKSRLEELVEERTAQLSEANRLLKQEVADHDRARERAEEASRAKSEFLATMSHEIRTPMNGMLGMLRIVREGRLSKAQRRDLEVAESSGNTLLAILNEILDYSKIESGHVELESSDFDLRRLLDGIVSLMAPRARDKGIALNVEVDSGVPACLRGDPGKLQQILFNLVGNGVKFTDEGGVALRVIPLGSPPDRPRLRFEVEDTGVGLPGELCDEVFEPFFQVDASITRRYGGTGLGLAICRRLVAAMGGTIGAERCGECGSLFWFELPLSPGDARASAQPARAKTEAFAAGIGRRSLLLVEDNEVNLLVARTFLEKMGHEVRVAVDGRGAVEAASNSDFDAILMDISLPGMDGVEATRRIRRLADPARSSVPIVAMSAHVFRSEIEAHLKAGMDAFIGKPLSPERLAGVLAQVLDVSGQPAAPQPAVNDAGGTDLRGLLAEDIRVLGRERTRRLVSLFLETTPKHVHELEAAVRGGKTKQAAFVAHNLKNSAGSLGLHTLAARSASLEAAAEAGRLAALAGLFDDLELAYRSACADLTEAWRELEARRAVGKTA